MVNEFRKFLDELNEQRWFYCLRCLVRSLITYGILALLSGIVLVLMKEPEDPAAMSAYYVFCLAAHVLIANTVIRAFKMFDTKTRREALSSGGEYLGRAKELKSAATRPEFIIETLVFILLPFAGYLLAHKRIVDLFFASKDLEYETARIVGAAMMIPVYLILNVLATSWARKYWKVLRNHEDPTAPSTMRKIKSWWYSDPDKSNLQLKDRMPESIVDTLGTLKQLFLGAFLYIFGFSILSPITAAFGGSAKAKLKMTVILLCSALVIAAVLFVILFVPKYVRAFFVRKKFIKRFKKVCKNGNFSVTDIKHPYLSVFKSTTDFDFTVTQNGVTYDCKLMSCLGRGATASFMEDGYLLRTRIIKFMRQELFRFESKTYYQFESKNKKILILCPIPKNVTVCKGGRLHIIDVGDNVYGYKFFNGQGFINALERECIDRF